jgi:hypothetical protein
MVSGADDVFGLHEASEMRSWRVWNFKILGPEHDQVRSLNCQGQMSHRSMRLSATLRRPARPERR